MTAISPERIAKANEVIAACLLEVHKLPEWTMNYERDCLEEAAELLRKRKYEKAIHVLGKGCDHAWRDKWTEDRPEAFACKEAFDILTGKEADA